MIHRQIRELLSNCNFLPKKNISSHIYIYIHTHFTLISNTKLDYKGKAKENTKYNALMIFNELHSHTKIIYLMRFKFN